MVTGLHGKVALVTGAGRGQGRAHAVTLARAGADVVCVDICGNLDTVEYDLATADDLNETVRLVEKEDRRAIAVTADVRSQERLDDAVATTLAEFGRLDVVVANAGVWGLKPFWELTDAEWAEMQDVVLAGVWRTVKAATPHLIEQQSGAIVLTASVNGIEGGQNFAHYTAFKHGVIGFMRAAAQELAPYGIRVNAVAPGFMDTPMNTWQGAMDYIAGHQGGTPEERLANGHHWTALKGSGALPAQATANAVTWLASDYAAHVTGIVLPVDGGHLVLAGVNNDPKF